MRAIQLLGAFAALAPLSLAAPVALDSTALPLNVLTLVKQRLNESAGDTWVGGTQMEALIELDYPSLSVFSSATYPPSSSAQPTELSSLVRKWASLRPSWTSQLAYENGGAAADPAALGVGWLVAAAFADDATKETYMSQAEQEVNYLLNSVPKTWDGAISHRPAGEPVSLWADFISMVPPFLAYYGVAKQDRSLVLEAYNQIKLYRSYLRTSSGSWKHVVQGEFTDAGLWSTGNGWAAHGIARVLATVQKCQWNETLASEAADLSSWGVEIVKAAFDNVKSDGLLPNYYDSASGSSFSDASGSALLAAAAYRLAQLGALTDESVIKQAAALRAAVNGKVDTSSGWVAPVVNPLSFKQQASQSPEGEAFVLLLQAAYEDYTSSTSP